MSFAEVRVRVEQERALGQLGAQRRAYASTIDRARSNEVTARVYVRSRVAQRRPDARRASSAARAAGRRVAAATAFAIAAGAATTGASPMPFAPNGPSGAGTSTMSVSISGTRSATGIA